MPSHDENKNCLEDHLPYEIDMLRVAAMRLRQIKEAGTDANICIEVFCAHARNLIEFFDSRPRRMDDFKADQFANGYTCAVNLEGKKRRRINRRIAHLTTERVGGNKITVGECLETYDELEPEIKRFMACLTPERLTALSERLEVKVPPQTFMVADPDSLLGGVMTTSPITTMTVVWPPPQARARDRAQGRRKLRTLRDAADVLLKVRKLVSILPKSFQKGRSEHVTRECQREAKKNQQHLLPKW
ncbi:MAG: hypothetical protein WCE79_24885 [Xanthobacteraceae bacterium]